jgi:hypothetical protein
VRQALVSSPRWLNEYVGWALKHMEEGDGQHEAVINFAVDLLSSRFATIWANQKSMATRKQRDCAEREEKRLRFDTENCEQCSRRKQWCCLACELAKVNAVSQFPLYLIVDICYTITAQTRMSSYTQDGQGLYAITKD